jgi:hypothetical protein
MKRSERVGTNLACHRIMRAPSAICSCLALTAGLAITTACSDEGREPSPRGTVTVAWNVDGEDSPGTCESIGANAFRVTIFYRGNVLESAQMPCDAPEPVEISLIASGEYVARAALTDSRGNALTEPVTSPTFSLGDQQALYIDVDFGSESTARIEL